MHNVCIVYTKCIQSAIISIMKMVRIDDEQYTELEMISYREDRSITGALKNIIKEYLENRSTAHTYTKETVENNTVKNIDNTTVNKPKRTMSAILTDITNTKSTMDEKMSCCQDSETKDDIYKKYNSIIQGLWDEYNEVKK